MLALPCGSAGQRRWRAPPAYRGRGRPFDYAQGRPRRARRLEDRVPSSAASGLLDTLPARSWQVIAWREGAKGALVKQAPRLRVYRAGYRGAATTTQGWLMGERPLPGHQGENKCYFAWGLDALELHGLLELAHCRWIVERLYQDAKGELGLDDYEGRLWQGLHRHVALVMLAHCYLTLRRSYGDEPPRAPPAPPGQAPDGLPTPRAGFSPHRAAPASPLCGGQFSRSSFSRWSGQS